MDRGWRGVLAAMAACLLILGPSGAAGAAAAGLSRPRCLDMPPGSTAAVDWLLRASTAQPFSDFVLGVRKYKLEGLLRQVSRGRALVIPSNAALQSKFVALGLYGWETKIPASAVAAFRHLVATGVAVKRSNIPASYGCTGNVYVAHQYGLTTNRLRLVNGQRAGARPGAVAAAAATAANYTEPEPLQFSVLGTGYNAYTGMPLSYGMSSLDPGLTLTPIFKLNASLVRTLRNLGGACTSQFSTTTFNSVSQMSTDISANLGVTAQFTAASGSLNFAFNQLASSTQSSQTITTVSSAKIYLGAWALGQSPAALPLSESFILAVGAVANSAASPSGTYDPSALQAIVDNFGTHYIKTVYWGGLASVISQMSSSSLSTLQQMNISVSISAQVKMVSLQAGVNYQDSNSQQVSQVLIPANVTLPMSTPNNTGAGGAPVPSFIDCTKWTANLIEAADQQGWRPPVYYTVAPITELLSYTWLFPLAMRSSLPAAQSQLLTYITQCGYSNATAFAAAAAAHTVNSSYVGCADNPAASTCVVGTYAVNGGPKAVGGGCGNCFNTGAEPGPGCLNNFAAACNATTCICSTATARAATLNSTAVPILYNQTFLDSVAYCIPLSQTPNATFSAFQKAQSS